MYVRHAVAWSPRVAGLGPPGFGPISPRRAPIGAADYGLSAAGIGTDTALLQTRVDDVLRAAVCRGGRPRTREVGACRENARSRARSGDRRRGGRRALARR